MDNQSGGNELPEIISELRGSFSQQKEIYFCYNQLIIPPLYTHIYALRYIFLMVKYEKFLDYFGLLSTMEKEKKICPQHNVFLTPMFHQF